MQKNPTTTKSLRVHSRSLYTPHSRTIENQKFTYSFTYGNKISPFSHPTPLCPSCLTLIYATLHLLFDHNFPIGLDPKRLVQTKEAAVHLKMKDFYGK